MTKLLYVIVGQESFEDFKKITEVVLKNKDADDDIVFILNGITTNKEMYDTFLSPLRMFLVIDKEKKAEFSEIEEKSVQLVNSKKLTSYDISIC